MFELLTRGVLIWLMYKAIGFALRLTWGIAKITASVLMALALPVLILCFIFVGGIALLIPVVMIAFAAGILKACL